MTDKVRAALFDVLGPLVGLTVLDAYAGSGAVGFEALSRGALHVTAIDFSRPAIAAISKNQHALGVSGRYSLHRNTVEAYLAHNYSDCFDVIIADPPYDRLKWDVLEKLGSLLANNGVLVVSHTSKQLGLPLGGLERFRQAVYGDSSMSYYRKNLT